MHHTSDAPPRPSVLHIFKVYYPDLFGGTLTVIRDICASLKDAFASAVLVCSQSAERREIVVNDVRVDRRDRGRHPNSDETEVCKTDARK
ncbi:MULTISPECIES: hypothetical protein [Bradyrhizobium]|uniref:hypothetical protein n=1 Tax=Bradyrhizobium TaxID=374 RepID=UPI00040AD1B7|nr:MULTISPECIES: hypothetical protein [Bradyrhizobium]WLB85789.1 hypothetical protein QIH91_22740 [Bradyrhizobium japonicum USDA 135]GLR95838.1 hypothetical protein GCM10007858_34750 [Bradyrhizobium liaoningense]